MMFTVGTGFMLNTRRLANAETGAVRGTTLVVEVIFKGCYLDNHGQLVTAQQLGPFVKYLNERFGDLLEKALPQPTPERIAEHLFNWLLVTMDVQVERVRVSEWSDTFQTTASYALEYPTLWSNFI